MSDQLTVMKFGGTSLEDEQAFQRVARIVSSNQSSNLVVIVSAMSGVTNALIKGFQRAGQGEASEALQTLERHFERHLKVISHLSATLREKMIVVIEQSRNEIIELLAHVSASRKTSSQPMDAMASHGERLSAKLLTSVLEEYGIPASYVDARLCIITNAEHGCAKPFLEETCRQTRAELQPLLKAKTVPVLGGFIGASKDGVTTTLGRGSSDYSATLISAALGAREVQIWTDVDGVMTADPDLVTSASTVSQLSYEEAAELARLGASVLHSKMIEPVVDQKIPVRILNSRAPERSGTLIWAGAEKTTQAVRAIANKTNLIRIDITSTPEFVANGFLGAIRNIFDRHYTQMEIVATSEVGISFACEEAGALSSLVQDLQQLGSVETKSRQAIISCVGDGVQSVDNSGKLLNILSEIDPALTWQNKSSHSLISMVDEDCVGPVVRQIHQGLFERGK
ncbi:MAG: aspartate kinase [Pyrinomonadaceae bacterium]|nr:aspartate kinase [Pyrinomonadaceae bacterium]